MAIVFLFLALAVGALCPPLGIVIFFIALIMSVNQAEDMTGRNYLTGQKIDP